MQVLCNYTTLVEAAKKKQNVSFTPSELTNFIRKIVNSDEIKFRTSRSSIVDTNTVQVGGLYDPDDDEDGYPSINVILYFNPAQPNIKFSEFNCGGLFLEVCETLLHEYCHQSQYRKRNWELPDPYQSSQKDLSLKAEEEYLGSPDEIEAYGVSIAAEIIIRNNFDMSKNLSKEINKVPMYQMYQTLFGKKHIVVDQVKNFAVQYLDHFKGINNVDQRRINTR